MNEQEFPVKITVHINHLAVNTRTDTRPHSVRESEYSSFSILETRLGAFHN